MKPAFHKHLSYLLTTHVYDSTIFMITVIPEIYSFAFLNRTVRMEFSNRAFTFGFNTIIFLVILLVLLYHPYSKSYLIFSCLCIHIAFIATPLFSCNNAIFIITCILPFYFLTYINRTIVLKLATEAY